MINKFRTLALATSSILMMGAAAQAADLYTPAPMPAYTGGWYFSAFGGANWLDDTSFLTNDILPLSLSNSYDAGFLVGGAVGYDMGQVLGPVGVRLEAEISYRNNDVDSHDLYEGDLLLTPDIDPSTGTTSALAGMGNVLFDLNAGGPFTLYGGGGIGVANVELDNHGDGFNVFMNDDDTVFAWQAIAGVGFEIAPSWIIDVQYRYFNASDVSLSANVQPFVNSSTDYESHSVLAGIRVKF